jgi:hypothetical protein
MACGGDIKGEGRLDERGEGTGGRAPSRHRSRVILVVLLHIETNVVTPRHWMYQRKRTTGRFGGGGALPLPFGSFCFCFCFFFVSRIALSRRGEGASCLFLSFPLLLWYHRHIIIMIRVLCSCTRVNDYRY